jgi:hypothetical protein
MVTSSLCLNNQKKKEENKEKQKARKEKKCPEVVKKLDREKDKFLVAVTNGAWR